MRSCGLVKKSKQFKSCRRKERLGMKSLLLKKLEEFKNLNLNIHKRGWDSNHQNAARNMLSVRIVNRTFLYLMVGCRSQRHVESKKHVEYARLSGSTQNISSFFSGAKSESNDLSVIVPL